MRRLVGYVVAQSLCVAVNLSLAAAAEHSIVLSVEPSAIEVNIQALQHPISTEQLSAIVSDLALLEKNIERERLEHLLISRLAELESPPSLSNEVLMDGDTELVASPELGAAELLRLEIETLPIGPEATVDDLRKRDEIVGKLAQLTDPDVRHSLLQLLEERERIAEDMGDKH